jgi:hypothetical protein
VAAIRHSRPAIRAAAACFFALLLALRLLGATGYMPAFERGALTVIACPDADDAAPLATGTTSHHHHGKGAHKHPTCPFAFAGSLGSLADVAPILAALVAVGGGLVTGRLFSFLGGHRRHERPPLRGPPLPA